MRRGCHRGVSTMRPWHCGSLVLLLLHILFFCVASTAGQSWIQQKQATIETGDCYTLQAEASTLGIDIKLRFTLNNPNTSRRVAANTYVLRVDVPDGIDYLAAKVFPPIKDMRFQPKVSDGMLVWEITPIPASRSKTAFTLYFAVEECRPLPPPLQFTALGFQIVNDAPVCQVRPAIQEITVHQKAKADKALECSPNSSTLASITALRLPSFNAYGPAGTRCIERGAPSNLRSPTVEECFVHCSYLLPEEPSYMNYLENGQGEPQCSCLGGTCTLRTTGSGETSRKKSRSRKLLLSALREEDFVDEVEPAPGGSVHVDQQEEEEDGEDMNSREFLAGEMGTTVREQRRELDEAVFGAYEITALATLPPTQSPTRTPTLSPTANCLIPSTFLANFEQCEPKLCSAFVWRIKHLNTSSSDLAEPTAYDVCRSACSYLTLGESGDKETDEMRGRCQTRCHEDGYASFACQAYCTDYPMDEACPRPGCSTLASMETNLEYCSQNLCDAYFPVLDTPLTGLNTTTYQVCKEACSAQQLGPEGTLETADQRERCRNLCVIDGVEQSLVCLNYCLSFPGDASVCPPPATVAAIVQAKTYTATPTPAPTAAPTVHCLAPEVFKEHMAFCDDSLCSPFKWKVSELSSVASNAETKGTAADICMSLCTGLTLGPLRYDGNGTVLAAPPHRVKCQARCEAEGQRGSFLCQSYCRDSPLDPVCSLPDCRTLESVEENLEVCDHNYCSALFAPKDYTKLSMGSLQEEIDLCGLPCSAQRLGGLDDPVTYEATLPMRERCQSRCVVEGLEKSVMCLSYCLSFPSDPACPDPAVVALLADSTLQDPDCYIPDVFAQNMEVCEKQLCDPLNWVEGLVPSNATSNPTAYDVCGGACSVEALGLPPAQDQPEDAILAEQRGWCKERCLLGGLDSFLCRRYCEHSPIDPVCPKPDCMTFASIEANPEYCDRSACLKFLPWDPFLAVSSKELRQEDVCTLACSAQRLGSGGLDTIVMRSHCQRLCTLSGPEGSRLCLSYCSSFPDDPVCPDDPAVVENLMALGKPPTPSPTPPVFQQPLQPLLMAAANASSIPPVLSINQLSLGYNPFLGLEPHEQLGVYMRNEIFQFHVDVQNVFLVQAPNPNLVPATVSRFSAPLEYFVTPELADCSYTSEVSGAIAKTRDDYMQNSWESKSMGLADIEVSGKVSVSMPGVPISGEAGAKTTLNAAVGNSKESQTGRVFESKGLTTSTTTRLKRSYYKAGLRLDRFNKESFTPSFRSDARELGHKAYNFNATMDFITKYGAYIYDSATMGASLYRSFFFSGDTDESAISDTRKSEEFKNVDVLVSSKNKQGSSVAVKNDDGTTVEFTFTDVERMGEFNAGGPSVDATTDTNSCAIGASIVPQIIEYALKPLWDPRIPLELFMLREEADNFRKYLFDATVAQLANGTSCQDTFGDCYGNGGICLPTYDPQTSIYAYRCENPARAGKAGTFEFDVYILGLETAQYGDNQPGYPHWWGHHTPSYKKGFPPFAEYPRQLGIFGHNQVEIFDGGASRGIHCPLTDANFWTGFNYQNTTDPGGAPLCDATVPRNFTVKPSNTGSTKVKLELSSVRTRGCAGATGWHDCRPKNDADIVEGYRSLVCNHDITAYYYAQPSMGVVVCPVSIAANGTRQVADDCYYIYKWIGSWSRPSRRFEQSEVDTELGLVAQLWLDRGRPGVNNKDGDYFFVVVVDPEPDMTFLSLSFDLKRFSDKPENIKPIYSNQGGLFNAPLPQQYGAQRTITFTELQAKLAQDLDVIL